MAERGAYLKVICDVFVGSQSLILLELVDYSLLVIVLVCQLQLLSVPQELFVQRQDIAAIRHYDCKYVNLLTNFVQWIHSQFRLIGTGWAQTFFPK